MGAAAARFPAVLRSGRRELRLSEPLIMGVVNVTPDSFSDGGRFLDAHSAVDHGRLLAAQGAAILDIGGESTRPGALALDESEELDRILPVIEGLRGLDVVLSVDTSKPAVMRAAIACGADMVNDINAFRAPGALEAIAASAVGMCIMHMQGEPRTMQAAPHYDHVVVEVAAFLQERVEAAEQAGIARERIVIDPGFGFGKTLEHNLELLRRLDVIAGIGLPVLAGLSRKSMLGRITGRPVDKRVHASVAAALLAVMKGARIVRVHDVEATRDALLVLEAVQAAAEQ